MGMKYANVDGRKKYEINGQVIKMNDYPELYVDRSDIKSLTFEHGKFTLVGFDDRYDQWLKDKEKRAISVAREMEESKKANEYIHAVHRDYPMIPPKSSEIPSYDIRRAEILPLMAQREHQVIDSTGRKWFCCEKCGKIDEEGEFVIMNRNNTGFCRDCIIPKL